LVDDIKEEINKRKIEEEKKKIQPEEPEESWDIDEEEDDWGVEEEVEEKPQQNALKQLLFGFGDKEKKDPLKEEIFPQKFKFFKPKETQTDPR
jgi:hypothetical protein